MVNSVNKAFGELVKALRKEKKWSQVKLSKTSKLHINTVYLIESGMNDPRMSTFLLIAKGLKMDSVTLMKQLIIRLQKTK